MAKPQLTLLKFLAAIVAFSWFSALAFADAVVYVSSGSFFGTVNLATGAYNEIGSSLSDAAHGLGTATNGSLVTMGSSGNLDAIHPATGGMTTVGASGLSPCPYLCSSSSVNSLANFNGQFYATDLANRLYSVNPATGSATLIGLTGIPAVPFVPFSLNQDGTLNLYNEALFSANGKFYATFDALALNPLTGTQTLLIPDALYQIDPVTGKATAIAPTTTGLGAAVEVNGITYGFLAITEQIVTLDLSNGNTTTLGPYDRNAGLISAAVSITPEPVSIGITVVGLGLTCLMVRRRHA